MGQDMHYEPSHKSKRENAPPVDSFTGDVQLDNEVSLDLVVGPVKVPDTAQLCGSVCMVFH